MGTFGRRRGGDGARLRSGARAYFADPVAYVRGAPAGRAPLAFRSGPQRFVVVRSSDDAWRVLVSNADAFVVGKWKRRARRFLGPTLNTLDGPVHRERRLLLQPALDRRRVAAAEPLIEAEVERALASISGGDTIDARALFDPLSLRIASRFLLDVELGDRAEALATDLGTVMTAVPRIGPAWPLTRGGRARARVARFASTVIAERRARPHHAGDLLGVLVGSGLPDDVMRGEVIAFLLAATDEPPSALAAAVYLLGRDELVQSDVAVELSRGTPGDVSPALDAVLRETLRLYPPARHVDRCPRRGSELGGSSLAAGANVIVSPLVLHRDPGVYERPDAFVPERWRDNGYTPPRGSFVPFGAGPHTCIGEALATAIVRATLAALVRRFRLRVHHDAPTPEPRMQRLQFEVTAR